MLNADFLRRVGLWIAAFGFIAVVPTGLLGAFAALTAEGQEPGWETGIAQFALMIFALPVFVGGWLFGVFFWFRMVVNGIRLKGELKRGLFGHRLEALWNAAYGWKDEDLTVKGLHYRRLALDGALGFGLSIGAMLLVVGLARLGGIKW